MEWNGLRVLTRVGYGRAHLKNYGAMYKSVQEAIALELPKSRRALTKAHLLLREHGKTICRDKSPACLRVPGGGCLRYRQPARAAPSGTELMLRVLILLHAAGRGGLVHAAFFVSSMYVDERGITIPGRVFSKREDVTVHIPRGRDRAR